ncbi:alpha-L-glutamate ligase-like protein [Haloferula rosea]|uniref:Alpha-L-glutamate ligase-like protein n=1 Tax=Haloferula rosea TaxID=490093 RepID=A0A934R8Z0_9BACT|nr:alpha-L-glutamate ligase-like protein [Haloferula rosea]MBK1827414.1 alpha-L-glutamate ligase-like protein [Haloferula rosea]
MKGWWHRFIRTPGELHALGVVGINMRNARFVLPNNPRRLYGLVDDKTQTKRIAAEREISIPETYGIVSNPAELRRVERLLGDRESFVIKPSRGSGGKGIMVIAEKDGEHYLKPSGARVTIEEIKHHLQNILAGLFSLGGLRDKALIEYRVKAARIMTDISFQGAPDIRVVMLHGYPLMAMLRAATRESDGRSNLHQGALGIGVDIATGRTIHAIHHGKSVELHPDLKVPLLGIQIPDWDHILDIAVTCHEMTGLGYLGVDLMVDEEKGPLMIEVNARPGLAIQMANGVGLLKRLVPVQRRAKEHPHDERRQKISFSRNTFASKSGIQPTSLP